jgi:hypothetical protein
LLLGVVVGGLVLLVGTTILAIRLAARSDDDHQVLQASSDHKESVDVGSHEKQTFTGDASLSVASAAKPEPRDTPDDPGRAPPATDRPRTPTVPADDASAIPRSPAPPLPDGPGTPREGPAGTEPVGALAPPPGERSWLPREMQDEVNKAIDKGVAYLKAGKQRPSGSWESNYPCAYAALPALTLLECGVPATDPLVQKAAAFVRGRVKSTKDRHTYQLSLALLFLDRLGEEKDRPLIRYIALRLVAGQTPDGGWTYNLPELTPSLENALERFLEQTRPQELDRLVQLPDGRRLDPVILQNNGQKALEKQGTARGQSRQPGSSGSQQSKNTPGSSGADQPGRSGAGGKLSDPAPPKKEVEPRKPLTEAETRKAVAKLPAKLKTIPAVVDAIDPTSTRALIGRGKVSDNSNTQFATLALWAATRHGLPLERSIDILARRFQKTQAIDGTWKYQPVVNLNAFGSPAMTGAGLLGLAVGHGLRADKEKIKDPLVEKGFRALAREIGKPLGADAKKRVTLRGKLRSQSPINMYFLWTVERVGVLYGIRTLDGKDWYRWGVEILLDSQKPIGVWEEGNYPGAGRTLDTCLALLFLKRANLATDLTRKLEFVIDGKSAMGSLGPP